MIYVDNMIMGGPNFEALCAMSKSQNVPLNMSNVQVLRYEPTSMYHTVDGMRGIIIESAPDSRFRNCQFIT